MSEEINQIELLKKKVIELENRLHLIEPFYNKLLNTTNVIVVWVDNNGIVKLINRAAETITGYSQEEIIGKNWFETLVPKDKYPNVWKVFEDYKNKEKVIEVLESPILTKNGKERIISWRNSVLKKGNDVLGIICLGIDITESLYLIDQFIDYQRSYKALVENLPGVIYKCKNDENYTMIDISVKSLDLTGYEAQEFLTGKVHYGNLIVEEDKKGVQEEIEKAIELNKPFQLTYRIKTKDGKIKYVWEQGVAVKEKSNLDITLEGYIVDITEKVEAEKQLEIQREFFKQLFENSPIAIVILDRNDRIIDVNKAFENLYLFNRDEVKNLTLNQLIVPPDLKKEGLNLSSKVLNNEVIFAETKRLRKDGSLIDVLVIGYPILYKGERIGIFGLYKDITEQKRMYELLKQEKAKIEELNNLKSNFLLNISHEIRTPLNSILGFSDLLFTELNELNYPDLVEFVKSIKRGGLRLLNLMDNIIEISLIESSRTEINLEKFCVRLVLDPVVNSFLNAASEKNLYLKTEYLTDFEILSDSKRLSMIFRNIIDNAIKFTDQGGITIKTYLSGINYGVVEIIDTGIGIPEKFKSRLFEPFSQASSGLTREFEGIGLGLHLSKKLIDLLNGKIEIESESNKGTTVRILLPLA